MGKNAHTMAKAWELISQNLPHTILFSCAMKNWRENPCISHMVKYTAGWESNCEKSSYYGKSMGTNFPGFPHSMGFTAFSIIWEIHEKTHAFPIWWSIPHDGNLIEKTPKLWKLYGNQFFRFSPFRWVLLSFPVLYYLFPCYRKLMRKHAFPIWWSIPQDGNLMEKDTHTMETAWEQISQTFPIQWVFLHFSTCYEKWNVWVPISQFLPMQWVLLHFLVLWVINDKTHAFPIWWSIP